MSVTPALNPTPEAPTAERPIRFWYRGDVVEVAGLAPTTTVLGWLREQARRTGTKEGCNEGDCGACTVAVAELQPDGELGLRNLNACLLYLPVLDGKALFTVEDLQGLCGGQLHPVQSALVTHHGSQCGFCTPGFVMTMWTAWEVAHEKGRAPSRQEWADTLAGNLCRCTGYRPILDAAQASLASHPPSGGANASADGTPAAVTGRLDGERTDATTCPRLDRARLKAQLRALQAAPALHYRALDPAVGAPRAFSMPRSSDELAQCLQAHPEARILGGATDIGLWTNKAHRDVGHLVYTGGAQDLHVIQEREGWLQLGGASTLEAAWSHLARHWPELGDLWRRFASPPVRHAGTLAGNVANGSPIGDGAPVLMGLQARLVLRCGSHRRTVPLDDFYLGYQRNALEPGEFIERIEVPLPSTGQVFRAWKISKRYDSDISAVCGGFGLHFSTAGALQKAVLAFGGMAATVRRARQAEQALQTAGWNRQGVTAAQAALTQDFQPLTDLRATAEYRLHAAQALLERLWLSVGGHEGKGDAGHMTDSGSPNVRSPESAAPRLEVWR